MLCRSSVSLALWVATFRNLVQYWMTFLWLKELETEWGSDMWGVKWLDKWY
jgi:hypothetical protein